MKALICGTAGQDGSYLAQLLLKKGYEVIGASCDAIMTSFSKLEQLGIRGDVQATSMAIADFRFLLNVFQHYSSDEIFESMGSLGFAQICKENGFEK